MLFAAFPAATNASFRPIFAMPARAGRLGYRSHQKTEGERARRSCHTDLSVLSDLPFLRVDAGGGMVEPARTGRGGPEPAFRHRFIRTDAIGVPFVAIGVLFAAMGVVVVTTEVLSARRNCRLHVGRGQSVNPAGRLTHSAGGAGLPPLGTGPSATSARA